jgi:hypothetical protein
MDLALICCSIAAMTPKMVRGAADSTRMAITPVWTLLSADGRIFARARRARRSRNVIRLVTTILVDTVRKVEAATVEATKFPPRKNTRAMRRPMCYESGVCQSA